MVLQLILAKLLFVGLIVPPAIGPLLDHPLMFTLVHDMYIPQREGVLEVLYRLEIRQFHRI